MSTFYKSEEIEIFAVLREEVVEVGIFLHTMRNFATEKGVQNSLDKINSAIAENKRVLSMTNYQLFELNKVEITNRMGMFEPFAII